MLQIIVNSDNIIPVDAVMTEQIEEDIEKRLARFENRLTRVVVHLKDENAHKNDGQDDKCCMIEARPEGMATINVSHHAPSISEAVIHSIRKIERRLDDSFGRLSISKKHDRPADPR